VGVTCLVPPSGRAHPELATRVPRSPRPTAPASGLDGQGVSPRRRPTSTAAQKRRLDLGPGVHPRRRTVPNGRPAAAVAVDEVLHTGTVRPGRVPGDAIDNRRREPRDELPRPTPRPPPRVTRDAPRRPSASRPPLRRGTPPGQPTDEQAVERYRYLLRTAPPEAIEAAHAEAFARLTPEQRRLVLEGLGADLPPRSGPTATTSGRWRGWRPGPRCGGPAPWSAPSGV
jgi:hypothetical protein